MDNKQIVHDKWLSLPEKDMQAVEQVKADKPNYTSFAFFMSLVYMTTFFSHTDNPIPNLYSWLIGIKGVGALLCVGLFIEPYWPAWLKQRFTTYWYFTLFYCLPFAFTLLLLLNTYSIEWIVCLSLAFTLLLVLVNWRSFIALTLVGVTLALVLYRIGVGPFPSLAADNLYLLIYSCAFSIAMGHIFALRKEQSLNALKLQNQQLAEEQQKNRQEIINTLKYKKFLLEELPAQLELDEETNVGEGVTDYIQQVIYRMTDYMQLGVTSVTVELLEQAIKGVYRLQGHSRPLLLFKQEIQQEEFEADLAKLKQILRNSLSYILQRNKEGHPILIAVEDATLGHDVIHMPGYTRMLEALRITITSENQLPPIKSLYKIDFSKSNMWIPQQADELPLVENARIIDAHYGYMDVSNPRTHIYVIPAHLRDIRGKVMELLKEPPAADPEELKHPLAIQLEKEMMEKLEGTNVDVNVIKSALDIIKKYHGGVRRKSGEPFFTHPMNVALILMEYSQEQDGIVGALLHDTVEDTSLTLAQIRKMFGKRVAFLVAKATNLEEYSRNRISLPDYENIMRILNYEDPLAALVKLSDRLHNMRTIQHHPKLSKQKSIAEETLKYFVPLAKELKLDKMAEELERLSQEVIAKKE